MGKEYIEQKTIEVEPGYIERVSYPNILTTGWLGPCIGIIFYDSLTKKGLGMHEADFQRVNLAERIERSVKGFFGSLNLVKVCAAGNCLTDIPRGTREHHIAGRGGVEKTLRKYFGNVDVQWLSDYAIGELTLDTLKRKIIFNRRLTLD